MKLFMFTVYMFLSLQMPKKSQFSLKRKKSKSELDFEDLLCPMDEKPPVGAVQAREAEVSWW